MNMDVVQAVLGDLTEIGLTLSGTSLQIPVYSTDNGSDLRSEDDVMKALVTLQAIKENDLINTIAPVFNLDATHIVSYGPGQWMSRTLQELTVGSGLRVVNAIYPAGQPTETVTGQSIVKMVDVLSSKDVLKADNWGVEFKPKVVKRAADGKKIVETRFTRVIGKPPVMMSGMTPTTSFLGIDLVAASNNAGYQGELAAGGLAIPPHFQMKLDELVKKSEPGVGICINMLYLNAYQWGFQFPMVLECAKQGYPIESITIGAGVPSPEKAEEIFQGLGEAGIDYIGFKPGSIQAIHDVLELADLNPGFHIMLQWTSGRGGGHHSFEDFHQPLLSVYGAIRERKNVILVIGSGFGDAESCFQYLDGSWSTKAPHSRFARMPVDGVLFGSRCMVAKEAATAYDVKKLIVDAPGLDDEKTWDMSYDGDAGGIVTVLSELGEPIHKVHTRGIALWKKYDEKYLSIPRGEARKQAILADKATIIQELNADFQKVYFGKKTDGTPVDLEDMTYAEVIRRMVELMYVRNGGDEAGRLAPNRWIDITYESRTFRVMTRSEQRFIRGGAKIVADDISKLDTEPEKCVDAFIKAYPEMETTLLADEDVAFFIDLCKDLRNGKPVNFIPLIDEDLPFWFKKDSLWCSEQLDAIVGRDAQRLCILHGPVAAKFSKKVDEPIADILGGIHDDFVKMLGGASPESITVTSPAVHQGATWDVLVMETPRVVVGKNWVPNPIARLVSSGEYNVVKASDNQVQLLHKETEELSADITLSGDSDVLLNVYDNEIDAKVTQTFTINHLTAPRSIHQNSNYASEIKDMYRKVWDCKDKVSIHDTFSSSVVISEKDVDEFNNAINYPTAGKAAPIDIATMAGWRPLVRALFAEELEGNLLKLVHLSHGYRLLSPDHRALVSVGERVDSEARVTSVTIQPGTGKKIRVEGTLYRYVSRTQRRYQWIRLHSEFLIRGNFTDYQSSFSSTTYESSMVCDTEAKVSVLMSKKWFKSNKTIAVGDRIVFRLNKVDERYTSPTTVTDVNVEGAVLVYSTGSQCSDTESANSDGFVDLSRGGKVELVEVGKVSFKSEDGEVFKGENPVIGYLKRESTVNVNGTMFESGGYELLKTPFVVQAPLESMSYASASRDFNPIHRNRTMANLAELPNGNTIVHGMWTAAMGRGVVEREAASGKPSRIASYEVEFVGMVFPGDNLCTTLKHVGVVDGRKVINVAVHNVKTRAMVMKGRAEIEQPKTAYMFTGQGSASVGMGMDRYEEKSSAKKVWDTADKHLRAMYGFSILQIVRENPKSLTIHFGGPQGKRIRENYLKISTQDPKTGKSVQLIKEITPNTKSFTFRSPEGLLFATQFSQPALVLVQKAAFEELVEGGFVPDDAVFAGHSLGEYAALASFADVMTIKSLVVTVFLRGMVMQNAVPRNSAGKSNYAMVAANPIRVRSDFTAQHLEKVVDLINQNEPLGKPLIQVVNFNIRGLQYVVAGELVALDALGLALNAIKATKADIVSVLMSCVAEGCTAAGNNKHLCEQAGVDYTLRRGKATIPLAGIDVPFHSRKLLGGVPAFRQLLEPVIDINNIACVTGRLVGKYIPNVNAVPFSLELDYIKDVYKHTQSKNLGELIEKYNSLSSAQISRTLIIELLAHQFAMPVQWIKTQDVIFKSKVERVIEMGPAATLATMAKTTLKSGLFGDKDEYDPAILWWKQDSEAVFYELENVGPQFAEFADSIQVEDEEDVEAEEAVKEEEVVAAPVAAPAPVVSAPVPVVATPASSGPAAEDAPVSAIHAVRVLLALKFKKSLSEIKETTTIKEMSSGKSAIQNEVVGEISGEFGNGPEGGAEMPLSELAAKFPGYNKLGKVTTKNINKMLANSLPGGFSASAAKQYLSQDKQLGTGRVESVLLHALTEQPKGRLGSAADAKQWLDKCVDSYASEAGVSLAPAAAPGGASPMMMMMSGMGGGAPAVPMSDVPVSAKHALSVLLSMKFNKSLSEIKDNTTIKALSNGKSAVQNEVVGDLAAEFGSGPEGGAELGVAELAAKFPTYNSLGKVTSKAITKMLAGKLPGGFSGSAAKQYLADQRLLPAGRTDAVLMHALTMQPTGRLASKEEATAWLDKVCDSYGSFVGETVPRAGAGGGAGPAMMMPQMMGGGGGDPELLNRLKKLIEGQMEVFDEFLDRNPHKAGAALEQEETLRKEAEAVLTSLYGELGEEFCELIQPQHDGNKVRVYDSYWNWVRQDAFDMHTHVLAAVRKASGEDVEVPRSSNPHYQAMAEWITSPKEVDSAGPPQAWFRNYLCNRSTPQLLTTVQYFSRTMHAVGNHEYAQIITLLAEQVKAWLHRVPVHVAFIESQLPCVRISKTTGAIEYYEVPRKGVQSAVEYVEEMSRGLYYSRSSASEVAAPEQVVELAPEGELSTDAEYDVPREDSPKASGRRPRSESQLRRELSQLDDLPTGPTLEKFRKTIPLSQVQEDVQSLEEDCKVEEYTSIHVTKHVPYIHLKSPSSVDQSVRIIDERLTSDYLSCLHDMGTSGVSFAGQVALVTGAGRGSIACELVKALLEGGATVIVTVRTSRTEEAMAKEYQRFRSMYEEFGSKNSKLILEPSNAASAQDMKNLIAHIYESLELDIDFVVPFAAAAERGKDISSIDSYSEMAHRMMLTNVVRLCGEIRSAKETRGIDTRPAMVLLPCSPNHGEFGNDGLYAESKLGCEALVNKWGSEGWENYLCLAAAVIGWTRSALMKQNNIVAPGVEALGCRTFSPAETTYNLMGLFHPKMVTLAAEQPLWADLTGNWVNIPNMNNAVNDIRANLKNQSMLEKAKVTSNKMDESVAKPLGASSKVIANLPIRREPLANPHKMGPAFPELPTEAKREELNKELAGMVDLRKVVVVVGYGEVGPWGNARTRWEMESFGEFSLEGSIEMAWMVGLIKPHNGPLKTNPRAKHIGWIDVESGEPVHDHEVKRRYEKTILKHCGIRIIEPELFEGYDPSKKSMLHQVAIERDLAPIEVESYEDALSYRDEIGAEQVSIYQREDGQWMLIVKKGSVVSVPKALKFNRRVAAQIPTGWDSQRLGVPQEIAESVDPVTLFTLVSTMEALVGAGLTDPYELYQYVHVSEVGNTSGGGMGGMRSLKRMFYERKLEKDIPSDTLAESFINTMPAWVNMLLLSSSGPVKTPVGACATAAESLDIGVETILSGKARVVIAGGYDDFGETGSYEFAQMGATSNSELELEKGRSPREASRPMTDSRAGFMEAQGAGMQVLMDAELAIEMGIPMYAILALTNTATDKQGRSVPAPGRGILTTAREVSGPPSPLLSVDFRKSNLNMDLESIEQWAKAQRTALVAQANACEDAEQADALLESRMKLIESMAERKRRAAFETWGQGFFKNDMTIAPLRGALAVWGLGIDDISVASFHGTSTKLNDKNESAVVNKQLTHLGRSEGNLVFVITQKYLTGHPKGAACAWMLNGMIQSMLTRSVPGNANLDNVDPILEENNFLLYPNRTLHVPEIKAAVLKSFGFGQAGAEALIVNPDRLLATLSKSVYDEYVAKRTKREQAAFRYHQGVFSGKHTLVQVKDAPPYTPEQEEHVYLDPSARATYDKTKKTWTFGSQFSHDLPSHLASKNEVSEASAQSTSGSSNKSVKVPAETRLQVTLQENAEGLRSGSSEKGIGLDVEPVATFTNMENREQFIARNFTSKEIEYCNSSADSAASYAGRWAAKEAVIKAMTSTSPNTRSLWQGPEGALKGIEVLPSASGAPTVHLHGHAKQVFEALSLSSVKVSISHSGDIAVAQAIAQ
mmetsp:Transcript_17053/g.37202  ORF Transcript_17053/g.37202 Transcript_17053/m.37202 type:complete len:3767 (-) Transcript_17053:37-11337(-)